MKNMTNVLLGEVDLEYHCLIWSQLSLRKSITKCGGIARANAQYRAMANATCKLVWSQKFLEELKFAKFLK